MSIGVSAELISAIAAAVAAIFAAVSAIASCYQVRLQRAEVKAARRRTLLCSGVRHQFSTMPLNGVIGSKALLDGMLAARACAGDTTLAELEDVLVDLAKEGFLGPSHFGGWTRAATMRG